MTETRPTCRYDREAKAHLTREHRSDCASVACPGCLPCERDDRGNPVRHCRTRLRCTSHLGWTEHACPTCLAKIRANLTRMLAELALMPEEATEQGINSEPANLAGPHANYVSAQWRLVNADRAGQTVEELDMLDPYTCLTMHERTIREALGHDEETLVSPSIAASAGYLAWVLTDLARDEEHAVFLQPLLSDTDALLRHVEGARRDGKAPERGVPCPECVDDLRAKENDLIARNVPKDDWPKLKAERLRRAYGHWCLRDGCDRLHFLDDSGDAWACPTDAGHEWTHEAYTRYVEERQGARRAS